MTTIVGHGFVGKALESVLLEQPNIVDLGDEIPADDLYFVCLPSPMAEDGSCDTSIIDEVLPKLNGRVVLRSTVPPDYLIGKDLTYWPEFLTEKNWREDVLNPSITVVSEAWLLDWIKDNTTIKLAETFVVKAPDASVIKYGINTFLAMKVVFFNQLHDVCGDWESVRKAVTSDPRVGESHTKVPGYHGKGYGGSCFPKDVSAFAEYVPLLKDVHAANQSFR